MISISLFAKADSFLLVPVQFIVENGTFNQTIVNVKSDDSLAYSINGQKNVRLKLKYGHNYMLAFSKPGYITKTIHINTIVAAERARYGFEPYKIGVRLFKQYEGINIVVYNQPVAYIHYHEDLDSYAYDVDYTKSIMSALSLAEKQLSQRAAEERAMAKRSTPKLEFEASDAVPVSHATEAHIILNKIKFESNENQFGIINTNQKPIENQKPIGSLSEFKESIILPSFSGGEEAPKNSNVGSGSDLPPTNSSTFGEDKPLAVINTTNGNDSPNSSNLSDKGRDKEPVISIQTKFHNKTLEEISDKGKTITYVRIFDGDQVFVYKKVKYAWGGVFYFKDNSTPIAEHTFNELSK